MSKFYTAPTAIRSLMKFGNDQTKVMERTPRNNPNKGKEVGTLKVYEKKIKSEKITKKGMRYADNLEKRKNNCSDTIMEV